MKKTALIMAGGRGERFWPKSRRDLPKQFLSLTADGKTMIQLTVERIRAIIDINDIFVATNKDYISLVRAQLPDLPEENILWEPVGKNTAPCIGLAAVHMKKRYEDAIMFVLPSDHLIKYVTLFTNTLLDASSKAEEGSNLITIGITPDYPETGYGYIHFDSSTRNDNVYCVKRFVEKPDLSTARTYLESDEYLWNSGMFVWKLSTICDCFQEFLPETYNGLLHISDSIHTVEYEQTLDFYYSRFGDVSIDYAIMEKTKNIFTIPGSFGWDDVGSWLAVERINKTDESGNYIQGNILSLDTKNCIIEGTQKLIATIGLENIIIVDTEDATLICQKECAGQIKKIVENLRNSNRTKYI